MLERLTSAAILSNGKDWALLQYHPPRQGKPAHVYVGRTELHLGEHDVSALPGQVKALMLKIAQLVVGQMEEVNKAVSESPDIEAASQDRLSGV